MASLSLNFPQPLAEKYRPMLISDFAGLEKPKKVLGNLAANPKPSNWIFCGPSGVGKTSMAFALANELKAEVHHIPSQNCNLAELQRACYTCNFVPMSGFAWHMVVIDEADRMTEGAQIALLSKLDFTDRPPNTIFVFTCNTTAGLEKRFLSRCMPLDFSSYGIAKEAEALLQRVWDAEVDQPTERPNFARIVKDSTNNLRDALMQLEICIMGI